MIIPASVTMAKGPGIGKAAATAAPVAAEPKDIANDTPHPQILLLTSALGHALDFMSYRDVRSGLLVERSLWSMQSSTSTL